MAPVHDGSASSLLPLLLALPAGAVVGVPAGLRHQIPSLEADLTAFGPWLRAEGELRHAVNRAPARLVVDARRLAAPLLEAALSALKRGGAAVALYADDRGALARLGERVLSHDGTGLAWLPSDAWRSGRCMEICVEGARPGRKEWIRIPLPPSEGAEEVLAARRADGVTVRESRIAYGWPPAR
jgi:hypothetical protein